MAAHPSMHYPQRIGEPDCRDYLRTGRCKYGESCKYNHPPNVESGGGIKTPLNPSEPAFPIRPGEPPCQYYLKHGSCKFGQTCKFHHPPHVCTTAPTGGLSGAVMMNLLNASQGGTGQQIITFNSGESGLGELQTQVLQLLPQRPGEQDCIYFLRNGRCKYGATCKYHHPIDGRQTNRHQEHSYVQVAPQGRFGRLRSSSVGSNVDTAPGGLAAVQFVQPPGAGHGSFSQRKGEPTHILLSEGPIRVMAINQGSSNRSTSQYQQASNSSSPAITSTSVASSYETAVSSLDYIPASAHGQYHQDSQGQVDSSGRYWRRTGSHDHLSLEGTSPHASHGNLQRLSSSHYGGSGSGRIPINRSGSMDGEGIQHEQIHSHHRGNEAGRSFHQDPRSRQASYGASMYSSGTDTSFPPSQSGTRWSSTSSTTIPSGNVDRSWDDNFNDLRRSSSPVEGKMGQGNLSSGGPDYHPDHLFRERSLRPPPTLGRPEIDEANMMSLQQSRARDAGSETDDGLSKMTSALLTMLDTPDGSHQAAHESTNEETIRVDSRISDSSLYHQDVYHSSGPPTPRQSGASLPRSPTTRDSLPRADSSGSFQHARQYSRASSYGHDHYHMGQQYRGGTLASSHSSQLKTNADGFISQRASHLRGTDDGHACPSSHGAEPVKWSPTWQNVNLQGRQMEQSAQSVSAFQPGSGTSNPNHSAHGGGLFLS